MEGSRRAHWQKGSWDDNGSVGNSLKRMSACMLSMLHQTQCADATIVNALHHILKLAAEDLRARRLGEAEVRAVLPLPLRKAGDVEEIGVVHPVVCQSVTAAPASATTNNWQSSRWTAAPATGRARQCVPGSLGVTIGRRHCAAQTCSHMTSDPFRSGCPGRNNL